MINLSLPLLLVCGCADMGERMLSNCTDTKSSICWPCEAGSWCRGGVQTPCDAGTWSGRGYGECVACSLRCPGQQIQLLPCGSASDRVCVDCPSGYRCDGDSAELCPVNTYSSTDDCLPCPLNSTSEAGSTACTESQCGPGEFMMTSGVCRVCPDGFGCDISGGITPCPGNKYSQNGRCVDCDPNSVSLERSDSVDKCICNAGYVKAHDHKCIPCKSGTVWHEDGLCVPCDAGYYCVGRVHRDVCPIDTFSHPGAALCTDCRPFSGCAKPPCVDSANCTCDDGYVEHGGECVRCRPGTLKSANGSCIPCSPGFECRGGADVKACDLGTFSAGNLTSCAQCTDCKQIVATRCNETHDSVCAKTTLPLAVIRINQDFHTDLDSDTFIMFAMIYASSLPKARLVSVCDLAVCMQCFQGVCPRTRPKLYGPAFRVLVEIRTDSNRVYQNIEALSQSNYLSDAATNTMRKLTDMPFTTRPRLDYEVICPDGKQWDLRLSLCYIPTEGDASPRTWLGLLLGICLLIAIGVYGGKRYRKGGGGWMRMSNNNEENS